MLKKEEVYKKPKKSIKKIKIVIKNICNGVILLKQNRIENKMGLYKNGNCGN